MLILNGFCAWIGQNSSAVIVFREMKFTNLSASDLRNSNWSLPVGKRKDPKWALNATFISSALRSTVKSLRHIREGMTNDLRMHSEPSGGAPTPVARMLLFLCNIGEMTLLVLHAA